ncbi:copper resistance CopC/CopD family protein [Streptomyces sp. AVP053U2]|uniref:copper resistance CopC/CopD family protein n=1 Tax=Streptomyces sp. AVP053U2 TaxID=1737066 RepID=UPI00073B8BE1|nr:copper resistance protein CopC [Streptomyces sp. AVP053U2]ODA73407.1 Copper transport protein YcnJ precursor [Streptomyces sp. AVP053U2]
MTQTIVPRVRILVLLFLAVTGALLAGAAPASAHAALTGSDPQQGTVVDQAPAQVSLTFSEPVAVSDDALRVLDPKGERVDKGDPAAASGTTYTVRLLGGLPDGTYTVTYQVVSADSHPVAGAFTFSVGAPSETSVEATVQASDDGLVGSLYGIGRYLSYAGFVVMVGGAAFVLACWRHGSGVRAVQRLVVSGWLTLTAATLALLLLRGSYTSSGKVADVFDLTLLSEVLQTKTGAALVSRLLLLAAAALFIAVLFGAARYEQNDEERRDLSFGLAIGGTVVSAGLAASWAMSEHASQGLQPGIAMPVDVVHLLAVATWLGGLTALLVALYRAPADTAVDAAAVRRFSRLAFGSVVALVGTGAYQSWRQLGSWSAFTDTRYGQLLLAKIGLVVVMVGIAYASRRWTARLAEPGAPVSLREEPKETVAAVSDSKGGATGAERGVPAADTDTDTDTDTDIDTDTEVERGKVADDTGPADVRPEESGAGAQAGVDSARAAQLARQRAAVASARQKRLRDSDPNLFGLRRSVLAEAGIAVVLLTITTVLTQTEPGRTEQEAASAASSSPATSSPSSSAAQGTGAVTLNMPFDTGGKNGRGVVTIDLDPARVGGNDLHVYVERTDGKAFDVPELKVALTLDSKDIGPLSVVPDHLATGHWSASGVQIPMAGDWTVEVTVRTSDIDQATVSKNAQIG